MSGILSPCHNLFIIPIIIIIIMPIKTYLLILTDELDKMIEEFKRENGLKTKNAAILELIRRGLKSKG